MTTRVKICGLKEADDTRAAVEAGADFIGVVFAEGRRRLSVEQAIRTLEPVPERGSLPFVLTASEGYPVEEWYYRAAQGIERTLAERRPLVVGVFRDQGADEINAIAEAVDLDLVQVGADEPWDMASELDRRPIKTVRGGSASFGSFKVGPYLCLLDSDQSGSGETFPWERAATIALNMPVMLAGGLTADNVAQAIEIVRPWAVDVSSGVERDGKKDPAMIRDFVQAAKGVA